LKYLKISKNLARYNWTIKTIMQNAQHWQSYKKF